MTKKEGLQNLLGNIKTTSNELEQKEIKDKILKIDIKLIDPNKDQPRKYFDAEKLLELSNSIKEEGLLQPITVVKKADGRYELIAGERRLKASKLAKLEKIEAIVRNNVNDKTKSILALVENVQRDNLSCIEISHSLKKMLDEYQLTQEQVAAKTGMSRSAVANYLRISNLPDYTQEKIEEGLIAFGHAKILAPLEEDFVINLTDEIINKELSVKKLTEYIKSYKPSTEKESNEKNENDNSEKSFSFEKFEEKFQKKYANLKFSKKENKVTIHFDDVEVLQKLLKKLV